MNLSGYLDHEEDCTCLDYHDRFLSASGQADGPQFAPQCVKDIWNEEMVFKMTRGTWADLIDGKPIGRCYVMADGAIRVERNKLVRCTSCGFQGTNDQFLAGHLASVCPNCKSDYTVQNAPQFPKDNQD